LKKPVCDRPLNQRGATILTNRGFLLERAEKMRAVAELIAERQAAADAKVAGAAHVSHVKLFMSIVPMAFGLVVCPTVRTSKILLKTKGKTREFLFSLYSMQFSDEEDLCNLRCTCTSMLKVVKLTTRIFPVTWAKNKARNAANAAAASAVVPDQALGAQWIQCNTCLRYRKLPTFVRLLHLNQSTWTCITTRQAIDAPPFTECKDWPQENGCPAVLGQFSTTSLTEENIAAENARMSEVRMRTQSMESEDEEYEVDSVDEILGCRRENNETNTDSDSDSIYRRRYQDQKNKDGEKNSDEDY
jgi:hypothetical protein